MNAFAPQPKATKPSHKAGTGAAPIPAIVPVAERRAAHSARSIAPDSNATRAHVIAIIKRIEGYLDEETGALQNYLDFDFKGSNDRKSQGLVDLNQVLRRLSQSDVNADLKRRLESFRAKLATNLKTIRLHLDAVKEIASILSNAIQDAESDGTYSRKIGPYRSTP